MQTFFRVKFACRRLPETSGVETHCLCSDKTMKHQFYLNHQQCFPAGILLKAIHPFSDQAQESNISTINNIEWKQKPRPRATPPKWLPVLTAVPRTWNTPNVSEPPRGSVGFYYLFIAGNCTYKWIFIYSRTCKKCRWKSLPRTDGNI